MTSMEIDASFSSEIQPSQVTSDNGIENRYALANTSHNSESRKSEEKASMSEVTPELMNIYYQRFFPYSMLYDWFRYGTVPGSNANLFLHREFSFTIEPTPGTEVYIRYQSFPTLQDFSAAIQKRRPNKIDIGAVFSIPPHLKSTVSTSSTTSGISAFGPTQREFVLDIDLTDYDDVRNCGCHSAQICPICWKFMYMAIQVLQTGLQDDFSFQHIQWFYSGRRGIHAWVCDETARTLTDQGRSAIANYFAVNLGNDKQELHLSHPLHPMLVRAYALLEPYFIRDIIVSKKKGGHGLLATADQWMKVLQRLPDFATEIRETLQQKWASSSSTPLEKWKELQSAVTHFAKHRTLPGGSDERSKKKARKLSHTEQQQLELFCTEIVLRYTYPRIDINVSKMRNHLLKSPFCVHPKTGRVCVPIPKAQLYTFDPFLVPTVKQIIQELDHAPTVVRDASMEDAKTTEATNRTSSDDWNQTSLAPYYHAFQKEFLQPLQQTQHRSERDAREQAAAMRGDF